MKCSKLFSNNLQTIKRIKSRVVLNELEAISRNDPEITSKCNVTILTFDLKKKKKETSKYFLNKHDSKSIYDRYLEF